MRIVAASLPYVACKFGGSTRSRMRPSTTHASTDAEDGKELSTSLSRWRKSAVFSFLAIVPSQYHSESGTGVKGNVNTWLRSICRLVARTINRPITCREHLSSAIFPFVDRRLLIPSCLNAKNFTFLIGSSKRVGLPRHSQTKFLWRSSPVCRKPRRHVFTSFEAAFPVLMLNRVCDWCTDMSKGHLYSYTEGETSQKSSTKMVIHVLELLTLHFGKDHVSELNILNNICLMHPYPPTALETHD